MVDLSVAIRQSPYRGRRLENRGPQTISQPGGSVTINPGTNLIQTAVNANNPGTTFWLTAGTHVITSSIVPKNGDVFVGELGAILDGTTWSSEDVNVSCFLSLLHGIVDVTIRNLEIRNMPANAIHVYEANRTWPSHWIVENNEIHDNGRFAANIGPFSIVRHNKLHHNGSGALGGNYSAFQSDGAQFINNEIGYGADEQRLQDGANYVFSDNWVHHNTSSGGIYFDGGLAGAIVDGNLSEDNTAAGIFMEMQPYDGFPDLATQNRVTNNVCRNNGSAGIHLSHSHYNQIYGNRLIDNLYGVNLYAACDRDNEGPPPNTFSDLRHVSIHHNVIRVPDVGGAYATILSTHVSCGSAYVNLTKDLNYYSNIYYVANAVGQYFLWDWLVSGKNWTQWQALPQDAGSTLIQY